MRFNAPEYLLQWKQTGKYPAIHNDIFQLASNCMNGLAALDLCCSTGLLAEHISAHHGIPVVGVDADEAALAKARAVGLSVDLQHMRIDSFNLEPLEKLVEQRQIETVLARRCLPELFGHALEAGRAFAQMLHRQQVLEVFVEGRVATKLAVNPLASLAKEVEMFAPHYRVSKTHRNVAYLTRVP